MASIDQRIVELKFDAKQFRSGIQAAISSLDNLKKNLKMDKAANEFDKVEKASKNVKFTDMYNSVENISSKFSTFGIVATTALVNIANTAVNTGKRMISALTNPLIEGGKRRALNIEQAKFQIKGLGYTWEEVEDDINYGVKNTAYGLDAAAKAASQLLASQVKVGTDMKAALRGISGVAAMTSSEYEDIANIFTTVAGNGRLMGDQLMQLSSRGLNAAATLADYLGVTETEVREMVSKGLIDFNTFATAMDSTFGEHAKKANETFTGSLSNMKAALARIGAEFATPAYQNLRDIFNAVTPAIDGVKKALVPLVDTAKEGMEVVKSFITSKFQGEAEEVTNRIKLQLAPVIERLNTIIRNLGQTVVNLLTTVRNVATPIINAFTDIFGFKILDLVVGVTEALKEFTGMLNGGMAESRMMTNLNKTFQGIFAIMSAVMQLLSKIAYYTTKVLWTAFVKVFGFISDIVLVITGHIGDWILSIKNFIHEIRNLEVVQRIFNKIGSATNLFGSILSWVYNGIRNLAVALTDKAFSIFGTILKGTLVVLKTFAEGIDYAVTKVRELVQRIRELPAVQQAISRLHEIFTRVKNAITDASTSFSGKFLNALKKGKSVISEFVSKLKDLASQYIKLPSLEEVVTNVLNFLVDAFEHGIDIFGSLKELLTDIFDRVRELGEISLTTIIENFNKLKDKIIEVVDVSGKLQFLTNMFGVVKEGAITAAQETGSFLDQAKNKISQFIEWIKTKFADLTLGDVMAAGVGGTFIAFLIQLTKFTRTADQLTQSLNNLTNWLNGFGGAITKVVKNFAKMEEAKAAQLKMAAITDIIKSVVLLAGAIALLATMDQEKVRHSAIVVGILAAALVGLVTAMNWISKNVSADVIAKSSVSMIAAAGSLLVLTLSLKLLGDIPIENIIQSLATLAVMMLEFAGLMALMNKISPEFDKSTWSIIAMASAMLLLGKAISMIGEIRIESLVSSLLVMTTLMAILGVMTKLAEKSKLDERAALGILGVVIALNLLIGALKKLSDMDSGRINQGLIRLIALMGAISLVFVATKYAGEHAVGAGIAVIAMSLAIHVLIAAINNIASIKDSTLRSASKALISILGIFALITLTTKFAGKHAVGAGASIMMMAGAMLVLSAAMLVISRMSDSEVKRATTAIVSVMGMFAIIVAATGQMRDAKSTMQVIAVTIGILAGALAILAMVEPQNLLNASLALSMVMGMFALIVASTGQIKKANATLVMMIGVIGVLAGLLYVLAQLPVENSIGAAASLSILLLSLAAAVDILQYFNPGAMSGIVAGLGAMGIVFAAILGVLAILAAINTATEGAAAEFLRNGIPMLQAIGQAIGEFVGGFIGGIAAGASAALVTLADNLTAFMNALQPFLQMVNDINDSTIESVKKLVEMVLLFAVADFIEGLNIFGSAGTAIRGMAETLPLLAETMKEFSNSLDGVSIDSLLKGTEAAKNIAEIATITREGGWLQGFIGSGNAGLKALTENLPAFGEALVAYSKSLTSNGGVDTNAINSSLEPAKGVIELGNMVNGEGGLLQVFGGSNSAGFQQLSENLPNFGKALVAYAECFTGNTNWNEVNNSIGAASAIVEVSNAIGPEGGALQAIAGSTALGNEMFAKNLVNLGNALVEYNEAVSGESFNTDTIMSTVEPLKALVEIGKSLNAEGGFLQGITGSTALADAMFAENVKRLGEALGLFSEATTGMNVESSSAAVTVASGIADVVSKLEPTGGMMQNIFGSQSNAFNSFANNTALLGLAIRAFAERVGGMPTDGIGPAINAAAALASISNHLSAEGGVVDFLFGSKANAFSSFSMNIALLGTGIRSFCDQVSGIDGSGINIAVTAAGKLVDISNKLESSGGVAGFLFGDKSDAFRQFSTNVGLLGEAIARFGESAGSSGAITILSTVTAVLGVFVSNVPNWVSQTDMLITIGNRLTEFGDSYKNFIGKLTDIDYGAIANSVSYMYLLGNAMNQFPKDFNGSALTNFIDTLKKAATDAVENFIQSLNDGAVRAGTAASFMVAYTMNQAIAKLVSYYNLFRSHGRALMLQVAYGISDGTSTVVGQVNTTIGQAVNAVRNHYNQMVSAGEYLCSGVSQGISNGYFWPINNVSAMGDDMVARLRKRLGIESPSKEGIAIGKFWNMGIAVGVVKFASKVFDAIDETADGMEDKMMERFSSGGLGSNLQPVITPELDLSNVNRGLDQLDERFALGAGVPINMQSTFLSSALTNMSRNELRKMELQNGTPTVVNNNYDMTQNNYSPKALSRIDIYRDTRNQFARLKGVVNT